ncbi:MAG TPA: PsbP-related protein [Candidatus Saccharimonadales bacterium]|nr:PsbP-related protein [Candidatus Saccharimonadales bacterium]
MPHHETKAEKSDNNLIIISLAGVFLIIAVLVLFFVQKNRSTNSSSNSSASTAATTTYKSPTLGYTVTYPSSWPKDETSGTMTDGQTYKIVLLNRKDADKITNGKPNIMIYENFKGDFCNTTDPNCKAETVTLNGKSVTKITNATIGTTIYKLDDNLLVFTFPNGDQAAIDKVMQSFTY